MRTPKGWGVLILLGIILLLLVIHHTAAQFGLFPEAWDIHLREPIDIFKSWLIANQTRHPIFVWFFDPVSTVIDFSLRRLEDVLLWLPWYVLVIGIAMVGQRGGGWRVGLVAGGSLLLMGALGLWEESMRTLALTGVSVLFALLVGIPLGIVASSSDRFEALLRPLLDAMQTLPAFVYLIPVLLFFGVARVPSVIATITYAIPPVIRLTNLGLRQVSPQVIEAAESFGSTSRQILFKVKLPLSVPTIMAGVNQCIMMALGIVVIAALIGAGGLGREVLVSMQRLQVGAALEAGLAIVFLAILLDRISASYAEPRRYRRDRARPFAPESWFGRIWIGLGRWSAASLSRLSTGLAAVLATLATAMRPQVNRKALTRRLRDPITRGAPIYAGLTLLALMTLTGFLPGVAEFPGALRIQIQGPVDHAVDWMRDNLYQIGDTPIGTGPFSDFLTIFVLDSLRDFLTTWLPWPVVVLSFAVLALVLANWRLALFSTAGLVAIGLLGMWGHSLDTLSQVIVAVLLALLLAIPLGILAGRSDLVEIGLKPVLDFLQTIPPFVYLVPVIMLFHVGRVPGIIASVLYALPPGIRLTSLGIRGVDPGLIEAARAFGSTSRQILTKVQLPLAMPSILLGINQTVIMVLAMVIIAGLVGGGGLGLEAIIGLAKNETGRGFEAGIAIVLMAIILDRLTQAWARSDRN